MDERLKAGFEDTCRIRSLTFLFCERLQIKKRAHRVGWLHIESAIAPPSHSLTSKNCYLASTLRRVGNPAHASFPLSGTSWPFAFSREDRLPRNVKQGQTIYLCIQYLAILDARLYTFKLFEPPSSDISG